MSFRVRDLAGAWRPVDLAAAMTGAEARDAVAAVVRLAPGTFGLVSAKGGGTGFHACLVGDSVCVCTCCARVPRWTRTGERERASERA